MIVRPSDPERGELLRQIVEDEHPDLASVDADSDVLKFQFSDPAKQKLRKQWDNRVKKALEARYRLRGLDTVDVAHQGSDRIVIQLPRDAERSIAELRDVAEASRGFRLSLVDDEGGNSLFGQLEGKLPEGATVCDVLDDSHIFIERGNEARRRVEDLLEKRLPEGRTVGYKFVLERPELNESATDNSESIMDLDKEGTSSSCRPDAEYWKTYLLKRDAPIRARHVADAKVRKESQTAEPVLSVTLTDEGAKHFENLTRMNTGRRFALAVGDVVHIAPTIEEAIPGGRLQVALSAFKSHEEQLRMARDLAKLLRNQTEPVELTFVEVRRDAGGP